ncbi:MAG: Ribosomal large subunit pseudouridine synthase [Planctomycetota bacterium]|jgi:RluA family pseudouridine synthase
MTRPSLTAAVRTADVGMPLLQWLVARFAYRDADGWRAELAAGRVLHNGRSAGGDELLAAGDRIECAHGNDAEARAIAILHEDDDLLVVDKPAGMVVQAASAFAGRTFLAPLAAARNLDELHAVHRLDRDTSGVLVLAKSSLAAATWQQRLAAAGTSKRYLALVRGTPTADRFACDLPIGGSQGAVKARRSTAPEALRPRRATTQFAVLARGRGATLLEARPATGRTHQIRVHLEALGLPLCGDKLYGRSDEAYLTDVANLEADPEVWCRSTGYARHLLHAERLTIPIETATAAFSAALPQDFRSGLAAAGIDVGVPF